jgi:hypothetical protein
LGHKWTAQSASGLQSLVWRHQWETSHDSNLKDKLIQYNLEDCNVLKAVVETITKISCGNDYSKTEIASIDDIPNESTYKFGENKYVFQELQFVNKCAYFDYQRDKIFFRNRNKKHPKTRIKNVTSAKYRINKTIELPIPCKCKRCNSSDLYRHGRLYKVVWDIKFINFGVKRWVVKYSTSRVRCRSCGLAFPPEDFHNINSKYGYNLKIWIIYQIIVLRQTYNRVQQGLKDIFKYQFSLQICQQSKYSIADYYYPTFQQIFSKLNKGQLIHADETSVSIRGKKSYIWVLTSLEEVIYIYSPTREGETLDEILHDFKGVLISDFYSAYDSFECPQQKCLIHLIRDMNDDLRNNPFDKKYKQVLKDFSKLLQSIIITVDKYGLKRRHLGKHKKDVEKYIDSLLGYHTDSEVVTKYQKRFKKYRNKLFTFLDYDGIPWNNNNAEHAIKYFATYRKITDGCFSEKGIRKYLILLSLYQTCKYKGIDFMSFLRSKKTDLYNYSNY